MLATIGLILGGALALFLIWGVVQFAVQCWKYRAFRGPFALPLVGNCYTPEATAILRYFVTLRKKYGKIYTFFNFTRVFLICCEPTIVRRVLSDSKTFYKGTDYTVKFAFVFGDGLVTSNGDKHRKDRSLLGKYFIKSSVVKYVGLMNSITKTAMSALLPKEGGVVDMEEFFGIVTFRNFMQFCVSCDFSDDLNKELRLCHGVSKSSNAMGRIVVFGLPLTRLLPEVRTAEDGCADVRKSMHPIIDKRRQEIKDGTAPDDPLTAMLLENLSPKEIDEHMVTLICAGHDTTSFFLSYLVHLLAANPDKQEILYRAIMDKIGDKEEVTADDFIEIKYLVMCMMETLRFYAIIPGVTRVAKEDVHFKEAGNVTIPKGTTVMIPMFVLNRDPELWDEPTKFIPERFEDRGTDFTSAKDGFFPFSYGSRTCIGNTFAQVESGIVICHVLRKYKLSSVPNYRLNIRSGISLTTSNGVKVVLEPR